MNGPKLFCINYTDPWIKGYDERTSRSIIVQFHGNDNLTIGKVRAGIEYSRPFIPKWSGTAGLIFQHANDTEDFYSSPLISRGNTHDDTLLAKFQSIYTGSSTMLAFNMEQGLTVWPEPLLFSRVTARTRKGIHIGPARFLFSLSGGHVVGNFLPHEAFSIGGTNSVRGYEEGAVGYGRSYVVGSVEIPFPMIGPVGGVIFADYGTVLRSEFSVRGAWLQLGSGYGFGFGVRVYSPFGPLRLEYALNDELTGRFHIGFGHRN